MRAKHSRWPGFVPYWGEQTPKRLNVRVSRTLPETYIRC